MSRLMRLLALPSRRKRVLAHAAVALLHSAWQVRRWPFPRIAAALGPVAAVVDTDTDTGTGTDVDSSKTAPAQALQVPPAVRDVQWAIGAWSRRWPWRPTCLMQALAARRLLLQQGLPCELYFGVRGHQAPAAGGGAAIAAHAWLRCGAHVVTGAAEARQHRPIAVYRAQGAGDSNGA